jgi:hypothetical protein
LFGFKEGGEGKAMIRRSTWIVLAVFVVLLAVFLIFQRVEEQSGDVPLEETSQPESVLLIEIPEDQVVVGLRIEDGEGNVVDIVRENAESDWVLRVPAADSTDVEKIDNLLTQLLALTTQGKLDPVPPLDAMGLDQPENTIALTTDNGVLHIIRVGNPTITGNQYYVQLGNQEPQITSKSAIDQAINLLTSLPILPPPTPEIPLDETPVP